ncbi:MAG: hypothetical protein Q8N78_03070 [Sulfurimonas sp.]|nr:hypothetical protein [Sulfurimonas sp.]
MTLKPSQKYNQENGMSKTQINRFNKISKILTIQSISDESKKSINTMISKINDVSFGNDTMSKQFNTLLNTIPKTDKSLVDEQIALLVETFTIIKDKVFAPVVVKKSNKSNSEKKHTVINFIKNLIVSDNGFNNLELQNFVNRLQNTNHMTDYFHINIVQENMSDIELVKTMRTHLTDYKQVNSRTLYNLSGGKESFVSDSQDIVKNNIDLEKVNRLNIPFGGSGMDFINVSPIIPEGMTVILNSINETNSQLFKDIKDERNPLVKGLLELEVELTQKTHKIVNKKQKLIESGWFFKQKLEKLNDLEKHNNYGLQTSILFMFLSNKTYGGNLEWKDGISYIPMGKDIKKYEKSCVSKVESFGYWVDKFDVVVETEDFSTILDLYEDENSFTILDPLYVKENETELLQTRTTYGNTKFPHRKCVDYTLGLKGQFIYHNYNNSKLIELFSTRSDVNVKEHKKSINNTDSVNGKKPKCVELIFHTTQKNSQVVNNNTYQPLQLVS